jgi:hypothetical protein
MYVRFGYPHVLVGISALAALAALLFWMLFGSGSLRMPWKLDSNSSPI